MMPEEAVLFDLAIARRLSVPDHRIRQLTYTAVRVSELLPPESTTWGKILHSLGIRYLTESANGIAFTFSDGR